MLFTIFVSALFLTLAAAQSVIVVQVAPGGMLMYQPNNITAPNGTIISFQFPPGSGTEGHSATQAAFDAPCVHLANGFNSGIRPNATDFNLTITDDSTPIWFYCEEDKHCGKGMVGAINAPSSGNTLDAFHTAALALGTNEPAQNETAPPVSSGVGAQAAPSATSPATTSASAKPSSGATHLAAGVGAIVFAGAMALIPA